MMREHLLNVDAWVIFGLLGQAFFTARFVVQWIASERRGESMVPVAFWYLSLAGGSILLAYALLYRHDLVFTLGQAAGLLVYARNLMLIRRSEVPEPAVAAVQRAAEGTPGAK
jgi:lipid-A-disaccharide synthase-like uncharacterized protein